MLVFFHPLLMLLAFIIMFDDREMFCWGVSKSGIVYVLAPSSCSTVRAHLPSLRSTAFPLKFHLIITQHILWFDQILSRTELIILNGPCMIPLATISSKETLNAGFDRKIDREPVPFFRSHNQRHNCGESH